MGSPRANKLVELSDAALADKFGDADLRKNKLDGDLKALKEEFDRRQLKFAEGARWTLTKDIEPTTRFDAKAAKAALGAKAKQFEIDSTRTKWIVRAVAAEKEARVAGAIIGAVMTEPAP